MPLINFSGIASGIDSESLIAATTDATRAVRVTPLQTRITELTETNDALTELKTKFNTLKSALQGVSTLAGGALSKTANSSSETALTATAQSTASNGTYTVSIDQKAVNGVFTMTDTFAALDTVIDAGFAGTETLVYTIGTGSDMETVTLNLSSTTTVSTLVNEFNSESTKAVMSAVNVGSPSSPSYKISVTSLNEGTAKGTIDATRNGFVTHFDPATATEQAALDAQIDVSGVADNIVRSTNSISDVIPGVTLNIQSAPASGVQVTVSDDTATSTSKVQDIVDAWNEIVKFIAENNTITRQEDGKNVSNVFGALAKTSVDNSALSSIRSALSAAVFSTGSQVRIFPDLGITTERDGTLKFDTSKFSTAISTEPASVNGLLKSFADSMSLTGGTIDQYTGFSRLLDNSIRNNNEQITDINKRISDAERQISKTEESMRARFARLESTIGKLQQQQNALTSSLSSLGK